MRRRMTAITVMWLLLFSLIEYIGSTAALAAQNNGTLVTLTQPEQILESITYQGITVDAIYTNAAHSGSDPIYSCAAFVKKFYQQVYGINVYNLHSSVSTPLVYDNKGSFIITDTPQVGDIVRDNGRTHWAIVKEVNEDTVAIIQQNYRTGTMAWADCTVDRRGTGYSFFTYSDRIADIPLPPAPELKVSSKTLYIGEENYAISLVQLSQTAQIYYSSQAPEIAEVSSEGNIRPVQPGKAIVYIHVVQDNMVTQLQLEITVKEPYLKLTAAKKELSVGELITIKAKRYGQKEGIISWQVSNKKIAVINEQTGELTAKKQGTVTVTAMTDAGLTAKLKLKVVE